MGRLDHREIITFTVEGRGPFPVDMLRFDECWPAGVSDAQAFLMEAGDKRRRVTLRAIQTAAHTRPTSKRWESFTWRVVEADDEPALTQGARN